ncbi:CARDB domain-containing protein [Patulibacter sp. NPDC049589]|uniref:CARDB domain-containing protein n=1 Tax=Patulibacter sp. NPDC049589 TaxID=3154731 RepID=UPI00342E495F
MRSTTIVAGITAGILGTAGVATATAATQPIGIVFTTGTTKVGTLPGVATATSAAPAAFQGTIDATSLQATFPSSTVTLPDGTLDSVDFGVPYGTGKLVLKTTPIGFTGAPNLTLFSLDLTGTFAYQLQATIGTTTYSCNSEAPVPVTLKGTAINPATGAYSASGSQTNLLLRAATPTNVAEGLFCTALALKVPPTAQITSTFTGFLAIPGLIPVPSAAPAATTPPVSSPTTSAPTTTPTTTKKGRLSVTVSKPASVKRGRSTVTKVVVRNTGAGTARSVTVKLSAAGKGVTPRSTSKTYTTIGAGKSRTFSVRLRTKATSPKSSALKVTAKGTGGLSASKSASLKLR